MFTAPPPTLGIVFRANYKWDRFAGIQWRPASAAQLMTSQESETSMLSACPIESEMGTLESFPAAMPLEGSGL